mgnify:FL=1
MTLKQLRAKARSLMRTANRRIDTYRKEGVINLSLESIIDNLKLAGMFNEKTDRISMAGLGERGLKVLIGYQEELKDVETVAKYKKKVVESYNENKEYTPQDVLDTIGKTETVKETDPETGEEIEVEKDITDYNYLARAARSFIDKYGVQYSEWIEQQAINGNFESRGDKLADIFTLFLKEYSGKEFTNEEIERMSNYEWEDMEKWSR